ncbi:MAG: hypothetical protein QM627_07515 [Luteolibacter sp.]
MSGKNMRGITKTAWDRVLAKACDVANAAEIDGDPMYEVHRLQMLELIDNLERHFSKPGSRIQPHSLSS